MNPNNFVTDTTLIKEAQIPNEYLPDYICLDDLQETLLETLPSGAEITMIYESDDDLYLQWEERHGGCP